MSNNHHKQGANMDISRQELQMLKQQEQEYTRLADTCSRKELMKCARFLAMYIALYRREFGEIPASGYTEMLNTTILDKELLQISMGGLQEATEMLKTVLLGSGTEVVPDTDTCIN